MRSIARRALPVLFSWLLLSAVANAGTLSGTVINRSTGKPEANVALDLLSPTQGMTELAEATSDAQGHFSVTKDSIGMAPILIRATVHDVSFNTFAPPGRPNVEVEVYDISKDPKTISVPQHIIIFQPQDGKLLGAEEYTIENSSNPPVAYFRSEGNFDFAIPENAKIGQVSATTSMGMAVAQASIDKGKGRFAIAYAFRPGQTNVRLSYDVAYGNNAASLKLPASYAGAKLLVVVPPGVTVTGAGLSAAGEEQGMMVYTHDALPVKGTLSVSVSGVPTGPAAGEEQQAGGQEGNSRQEQGPEVIAAPSRLNDFKWYLFAGLIALFAMGALMLSRKQVVVAAGGDEAAVGSDAAKPSKSASASANKSKKSSPASAGVAAAPASNHNASAQVDQHVANSLDSLKEQIFRLELRRQAGTISEEEYAREKARFDKLLREMVQG
ncbi:MAG TPA: SHOCT domain-containing protein [Candidatus Sulfotelmatobacter sp.]|nr:SHOCT domain-containing protein [Candidatus Sulfotelmatobacter sp.]